jgi:levanbiose-producing levanase
VKLRILVDRTSVEHSAEVFPCLIDTGPALFTIDGTAVFRNVVIREFTV